METVGDRSITDPGSGTLYWAAADLFVFPSETDTAGNVVLEAQASGLPVLVTDVGGPKENMVDSESGYVCVDVRAFARRVVELAGNRERRRRMAAGARSYAMTRSWDAALDPLYRAYREMTMPAVSVTDRPESRMAWSAPDSMLKGRTRA